MRDESHAALLGHLVASRKEVELALAADDPRWLDFRPAVPADVRSPETVSVIDVRPGLPGHVSLHWIDSLRAQRYAIEGGWVRARSLRASRWCRIRWRT